MILFIIDTSGKNGSLGLAKNEGGEVRLLASESLAGGQYSAELIPKFAAMLDQCSLTKKNVDAIAVVAGPGSFTGLRVGLAAAKGLAEILQKPLTALSALEALAATSQPTTGSVVAALDAGRSEVFLGHCELHPKLEIRTISESLVKQAEMGERLREIGAPLVTADEKIAALAQSANILVERVDPPSVGVLSAIAFAQLERGVTVRPDDLDANYIRRTDAELFSAPFL
ncbi:MAG TPA: tRNA (adenosine(37)-N6)-threonylcarbamoyltransferase complex dimerization subunit type 1 TsaB [Candidatus Koribacter sp.]|jgi:tRNA threonylcarbamoyladenosine biosynthesis protein TsaB